MSLASSCSVAAARAARMNASAIAALEDSRDRRLSAGIVDNLLPI
ncbi:MULTISPECIES: hypothetical protein [Sphingobium]|nr:hypothetical protein [Sphingobium sp. MI1205]